MRDKAWLVLTLVSLLSIAGSAVMLRRAKAPTPSAPELGALEKRVLMNLDALRRVQGVPDVADFLKELDATPNLSAALERGLDPGSAESFRALVARYASRAAFLRAVESPEAAGAPKDPASCGEAKPAPARPPSYLEPTSSSGCSDAAPGTPLPITPQ